MIRINRHVILLFLLFAVIVLTHNGEPPKQETPKTTSDVHPSEGSPKKSDENKRRVPQSQNGEKSRGKTHSGQGKKNHAQNRRQPTEIEIALEQVVQPIAAVQRAILGSLKGFLVNASKQLGEGLRGWMTFEGQLTQIIVSVLIVSLPSLPVFFMMQLLAKIGERLLGKKDGIGGSERVLRYMMLFACGTLLGDVFLHMLPHLHEETEATHNHHHHGHNHGQSHSHGHGKSHGHTAEDIESYFIILLGILSFYLVDKILLDSHGGHHHHPHGQVHSVVETSPADKKKASSKEEKSKHSHSHDDAHHARGNVWAYLLGDLYHNVTDGLALGASYSISTKLGVTTTLAIFLHEIPHEIGDFAFLMMRKQSLWKILGTQLLTATGALVGGVIGHFWGEIGKTTLLAFSAGGFLYLSLTTMLPEVKETSSPVNRKRELVLEAIVYLIGVYLMYGIALAE